MIAASSWSVSSPRITARRFGTMWAANRSVRYGPESGPIMLTSSFVVHDPKRTLGVAARLSCGPAENDRTLTFGTSVDEASLRAMSKPKRILMLAFPDCQMLDVTGPLQMFAGVNDELGRQAYELVIVAPRRGPFKTSSGVSLVADLAIADVSPATCRTSDTLMAAGGDPGLGRALESGEIAALIKAASRRGDRKSVV